MSEYEESVALANKVLDRVSADPDDDLALLSRQYLRALERERKLRRALVGLVGSDSKEELEAQELGMRLLPVAEADKAVSLDAIHALLETVDYR